MTDVDTAVQAYREARAALSTAKARYDAAETEAAKAEKAWKDAKWEARIAKERLGNAVAGPEDPADYEPIARLEVS